MRNHINEELSFDLHTISFLFSYHKNAKVETLKLENFLRAIPNVTVVTPQETRSQGGRKFIDFHIKVHSQFVGDRGLNYYIKSVLIPSIKKNCPENYRPTILDWSIEDDRKNPQQALYRWKK